MTVLSEIAMELCYGNRGTSVMIPVCFDPVWKLSIQRFGEVESAPSFLGASMNVVQLPFMDIYVLTCSLVFEGLLRFQAVVLVVSVLQSAKGGDEQKSPLTPS